MRAWVLQEKCGPEGLQRQEVADPRPGPGDLLIRIQATALNRADLLQSRGLYPAPAAEYEIPGLELAGVVEAAGSKVRNFAVGDRVMALVAQSAWAEKIAVPAGLCLHVPDSMDTVAAGCWMEAAVTVFDALVLQGGLKAGERTLVHAGASGIGTQAISIVRELGAEIAVTCSTRKMEYVAAIQPDLLVDYEQQDFAQAVAEWAPEGVQVVLDPLGAGALEGNLRVLAKKGRLVIIGFMQGRVAEVDLSVLMQKRIQLIGSVLRSRGHVEKTELIRRLDESMRPSLERGMLDPIIHREFTFDELPKALACLDRRENIGKIAVHVES